MRLRMLVNGRALAACRAGYYIHTHTRARAHTRTRARRYGRDRRIERHPLNLAPRARPPFATACTACDPLEASGESPAFARSVI